MILNLWNDLEKATESFNKWIMTNSNSWIFWLCMFCVGLLVAILAIVYLDRPGKK